MAKRGPKPSNNQTKLLAGSRADRIPEGIDPEPTGCPEPPAYLTDEALDEWARMVALLDARGTLSAADGPALGLYCALFARLVECEREIARNGLTIETALGGEKTAPAVQIAAGTVRQMAALLIEFGCTPSARGNCKSDAPAAPDALGQFILRKQG